MPENQSLLQQLEQMLSWKKSKKFYADKLGITESEVDELLKEIRSSEQAIDDAEVGNYITELEEQVVRFFEDVQKGTGEVVFNSKEEIKSLDELIEKCKNVYLCVSLDGLHSTNDWYRWPSKFNEVIESCIQKDLYMRDLLLQL
mgnify:CR=1 FL=1